jgi:hypothetical protein
MDTIQSNDTPIDVNSDVTPITKTPVKQVTSDEWNETNLTELHDQLMTLRSRYNAMLNMEKYDIAKQIQQGIVQLEATIKQKNAEKYKNR